MPRAAHPRQGNRTSPGLNARRDLRPRPQARLTNRQRRSEIGIPLRKCSERRPGRPGKTPQEGRPAPGSANFWELPLAPGGPGSLGGPAPGSANFWELPKSLLAGMSGAPPAPTRLPKPPPRDPTRRGGRPVTPRCSNPTTVVARAQEWGNASAHSKTPHSKPPFAAGMRGDAHLRTLLDRTGSSSLSDHLRQSGKK